MLDYYDDYVPVEECAQRLGISKERVMEVVEHRILTAHWDGCLLVQPALLARHHDGAPGMTEQEYMTGEETAALTGSHPGPRGGPVL
jgi:hypothetical protein